MVLIINNNNNKSDKIVIEFIRIKQKTTYFRLAYFNFMHYKINGSS